MIEFNIHGGWGGNNVRTFSDRDETRLAQDQFFILDPDEELPGNEYIDQLDDLSLFTDGITRCLLKLGYHDFECDVGKTVSLVRECCVKAGVDISRQTLVNWFTGSIPSASAAGRENVYKLCFALKLTADETCEFFLKSYLERPFNYKNIHEAVYFFCLNTGRDYTNAVRLIEQIDASPLVDNPDAIDLTEAIGEHLQGISDEKEFLDFIADNRSGFNCQNKTATDKIEELIREAMPLAEQEYRMFHEAEEGYVPRTINSIDALLSVIYDYSAREVFEDKKVHQQSISKSAFPDTIKRNFPQRQQFENILKHKASYDSIRKALIMLNFYCFFADVRVNKKAESADLYDDFVWDTNTLLYERGYVQLYWRNPFDWLIGHCATATSPLDRLRGLIDAYYLRGTDSSAE